MTKAASFINHLGGADVVAKKLGLDSNTPRVWISRDRIPRQSWPELMKAYPRKATLKRLLETESN